MKRDETIQNYNAIFWNFVIKYDTSNSNILRKIIHSFSVAEKCYSIACYFRLNKKQRNFCYLIGLFHDIGRFEQWKVYQTFNDKNSVDHGDLGEQILLLNFNEKDFNITKKYFQIMTKTIKYHTKPYLYKDKNVDYFCNIIKNADAYSNVITTANGAQQMTVEKNGVSKEILDDFIRQKLLLKYSPKTKLDRCLMLTACAYYINFDHIRKEIVDKNYIDIIYETFSQYLNIEDKKIYMNAITSLKDEYLK